MPCQHYKDALIEAAASGAAPQGGLQAHLAECAFCRAAFVQEQSLFAAIDAGLHTAANTEVPISLLPRVRAGLYEVAVASLLRWVQPLVFASAGVVLALMVFLVARSHHGVPENVAKQSPVVAPTPLIPETSTNPAEIPPVGTQTASTGTNPSYSVRSSTLVHPVASSTLEVLVPSDEREALASFVATLSQRSDLAAALFTQTTEKKDGLVGVDPLHIADIEVKPLEGGGTETLNNASEKR
jgi:hypothetical protein